MYNLKSEFSFKEAVIVPSIIAMIFGTLILMLSFVTYKMVLEGEPLYKTTIWPVLLFSLLSLYYIYYYLKIFKTYRFDKRGIHVSNVFGEKFYSWKTVKEISVVGKEFESVLWVTVVEDGSCIYLNNEEELVILTKYYANMPEIRRLLITVNDDLFLKEIRSFEKGNSKREEEQNLNDLEEGKVIFKGTPVFTFNVLMICCWQFFGVLIFIYRYTSMTIAGGIFLIGIPVIFLYLNGFRLYYFQLKDNLLIVKNHLPFFKSYEYKISDLKQIHVESNPRKANGLRVVTKNYETKFYMADSLWNKHWKKLIKSLRGRNILVEDELFFNDY